MNRPLPPEIGLALLRSWRVANPQITEVCEVEKRVDPPSIDPARNQHSPVCPHEILAGMLKASDFPEHFPTPVCDSEVTGEVVRCPYCGNWVDEDDIERPSHHCHHEIQPEPKDE